MSDKKMIKLKCPNCGKDFEDDEEHKALQEYGTKDNLIGYDCYCKHCKWSGNIEPDGVLSLIGDKEK